MKTKILYGIYFLSGTAGLIYEVLWMRYFSRLFGNTAKGAAMVLMVFFLGMAVGSRWGGQKAARSKNPLRLYAGLELGLALAAAPIPFLLSFYEWFYPVFFTAFEGWPFVFDLVRFFMALLITLPAGIFLGASFPVMGEVLIKNRAFIGSTSARLYGLNTLGAACGVILTGFLLPPLIGISKSYGLAVAINLALGGLAVLILNRDSAPKKVVISRMEKRRLGGSEARITPDEYLPKRALLLVAFASGLGMIALEVFWTRMLALVLQNSVYSFSAIVLVVLIGLASGALCISCFEKHIRRSALFLSFSLAATAFFVLLSPALFFKLTGLSYFALGVGWPGYLFQVVKLSAALIFLPTLFAGMALPLLWRIFDRASSSVGLSLGRVTLWNLLGSIFGAWVAGFLLLPLIGLWQGMALMATLYLLLSQGVFFFVHLSRSPLQKTLLRSRQWAAGAVTLCSGLALFVAWPGDYTVQRLKAGEHLLYLHEGGEAAVSVVEDAAKIRWLKSNNTYHLGATASVVGEKRLGHLPLLLHPSPKQVAFVGIGTGISMSAALDHGVDEILGIEILPGVLGALPYFAEQNHDLLSQKKVKVVLLDGRVYLKSTDKRFDVVVADLFVPWHAGIGSLYTREHFMAVRAHLKPGGIFVQWLPLYQMSEWDFGVVTATFSEVFPEASFWRGDFSSKSPILGLVGSTAPLMLDKTKLDARLKSLATRTKTADPLLRNVSDFGLLYGGDLKEVAAWQASFPINTENRPVIEFQSPTEQTEGRSFTQAALSGFYQPLEGGAVLLKDSEISDAAPLSAQAGNLLFQAVEAGLARNTQRQRDSLQKAAALQPESSYLKMFHVVLQAVDAGAGRGRLEPGLRERRGLN